MLGKMITKATIEGAKISNFSESKQGVTIDERVSYKALKTTSQNRKILYTR